MSWLRKYHNDLREQNGGKLTQAIINADYRRRGWRVTRQMLRYEDREREREKRSK